MLFSGARDGTAYCFAICTAWRPLRSYACSQYPPAHHPPKKQSTGLFFQTEYALLGFKSPHIKTKKHPFGWFFVLVRETGLEPVRCEPHAPQTCASASSATLAYSIRRCSLATPLLYQNLFGLSTPFCSFFVFYFLYQISPQKPWFLWGYCYILFSCDATSYVHAACRCV